MGIDKQISILADTIQGEVNRMCVTEDLAELDSMAQHARKNIDKLQKLVYERHKQDNGVNCFMRFLRWDATGEILKCEDCCYHGKCVDEVGE